MRRRAIPVLIIAVVVAILYGTYTLAYRAGESSGKSKVSSDRSAFQTRVASAPQSAAGGGTGSSTAGGPGARGAAGGSAAAGGGATGPRGGAVGTGTTGTPAAAGNGPGAGAASALTGKVTKADGATLTVQQADNSMVSVTTTADTAVRKYVAGALTDLKAGDIVAIDGGKTGDTAYSAKTVTSLGAAASGAPGGGAAARGQGGPQAGGTAPVFTGQIKSLNGGTIMMQGFDGTMATVTTTATTIVRTQQTGTMSDIKVGDVLLVQGDKTSDTAFAARSITDQGTTSG